MNITQSLDLSTINLINKLLSPEIKFRPILAEVGGGATEGLFLSQLFDWTQAINNGEEWLERTYQQWHEVTYLTRRELDAARKKLKALGILEEKKVGNKQNILYKLDVTGLFKLIVKTCNLSTDIPDQVVTVESGFEVYRDVEVKQLELLPVKSLEYIEKARPLLEIPVENDKEVSSVKLPVFPEVNNLQPLLLRDTLDASNYISPINKTNDLGNIPLPNGKASISSAYSNVGIIPDSVISILPVSVPIEYKPLPLQQTYSSTQKFEDRWKPKPLQPWRTSLGKHQYKPEIVKYLKDIYLPKTPHYEGKEITPGQVMMWLAKREYDEQGLALIEAMMIDYQEYITSPAANAARVLEEIDNLPKWVKTSWAWVRTQYKEYLECGCDLSKFHYTKSQEEIDVWELWISKTFPDNFPNMVADKNKVLSSLRSVA